MVDTEFSSDLGEFVFTKFSQFIAFLLSNFQEDSLFAIQLKDMVACNMDVRQNAKKVIRNHRS